MEVNMKGIVFVIDVVCYAIHHLLFLGLICFEDPVPYDEGGAVILIDVFFLAAMVHTVIGRRGEYVFNEPGHLAYVFGVNPELEQHCDLVCNKDDDGMKTDEGNRQEKDHLDILDPA
jgi:hypothetical protein